MSNEFKIGLIQTAVSSDPAENNDRFEGLIAQAASGGAQIVCLQELFHSAYFCTTEDHRFFDMSEPIDGPLVKRFQQVARSLSVVLILPFFERRAAGVYHNSAAVIDTDGSLLGLYRKMHIPDDPLYFEKFYFAPGDIKPGYQVFKTPFARIGILICWDQWYPEAARLTALQGAEVLFYPTAIGWHPAEKSQYGEQQRNAWHSIQRAHAIANGVYVAAPNRCGFEDTPGTDGIEFFGSSFICDPFGSFIETAGEKEEILIATCDRNKIEETRQLWPFLRDRRIDSYNQLSQRWID